MIVGKLSCAWHPCRPWQYLSHISVHFENIRHEITCGGIFFHIIIRDIRPARLAWVYEYDSVRRLCSFSNNKCTASLPHVQTRVHLSRRSISLRYDRCHATFRPKIVNTRHHICLYDRSSSMHQYEDGFPKIDKHAPWYHQFLFIFRTRNSRRM